MSEGVMNNPIIKLLVGVRPSEVLGYPDGRTPIRSVIANEVRVRQSLRDR
jgi:hypothetical protein